MMQIGYDIATRLDWREAVAALEGGHRLPRAEIGDVFLGPQSGTSLTRAAFIDGLGYGVKSVTVFPENPTRDLPSVQGAMLVFAPDDGRVTAVIDSKLVTEFKTAADSVLGARLLGPPEPRTLAILGGGTVAASLCRAYPANFPSIERILVWTRRPEQAADFAAAQNKMLRQEHSAGPAVEPMMHIEDAVGQADIVSTATMATSPILAGDTVGPGTHVDLIGAFRKDMREADDALLRKGRLYVDSRDTTIDHIGELAIPIAEGNLSVDDIRGDFYDIVADRPVRDHDDITVFKNGGGAHLDLMIADWIARHA